MANQAKPPLRLIQISMTEYHCSGCPEKIIITKASSLGTLQLEHQLQKLWEQHIERYHTDLKA